MSEAPQLTDDPLDIVEEETEDAKLGSIRSKIFRRFLPVVLIPLIGLSILAIVGALVLQQRTADAVSSAEEILNEEVVAAGAERSADASSREVAEFVDGIILRTTRVANESSFREEAISASNELAAGDTDALVGGGVLALNARDRITVDETDIQVVLVSGDGTLLGTTHPEEELNPENFGDWLEPALSDPSSFRSFVDDGEHVPSFEIALEVQEPATIDGTAVLRVRVPLNNLHGILDQLSEEAGVDSGIIDIGSSVIIADTATEHDPLFLFSPGQFTNPASGLDVEMVDVTEDTAIEPTTIAGEEVISVVRPVGELQSNSLEAQVDWVIQTNQPADVAAQSLDEIRDVSETVEEQRGLIFIAVGLLLLLALFFAFVAIRSIAGSITAPVAKLSEQARVAAQEGIPAVVEAARTSERLPELPAFEVESNDELSQLADSLNTMQGAAVDLAAGQAKLRRQNVARTFVSLGRRNQNLLNRQLEFIDELERQESDPDTLENLFRLDHLATRMRRNAENLLVLAGEQTPRRWGKPIAVRDVVRAAAAEIADYRRVKLGDIDTATVSGNLATDLSHLIAELLENAGSFSPPNTNIEVLGQLGSSHYRLAIVDQGIGMDDRAMAEANGRLKNPVDFADAPSAYLGLFVVGRLSQDLGITVRLTSADPTGEGKRRGTIAFVDLPVRLLSSEQANPIEVTARTSEAAAAAPTPVADGEGFEAPTLSPAAPAAAVAAPIPATAAGAAEPVGTTSAGFPQRRGRKGGAAPETPENAPRPEPAAAEATPTAPAAAPVAEAPAAVPTAPAAAAVTSAGFPKRRSKSSEESSPEAAPVGAAAVDEDAPPIQRDATAVSDSLRSFRAAVARGRQVGQDEQAPAAGAPAAATPISAPVPQPAVAPAPVAPAVTPPPTAVAPPAQPPAQPPAAPGAAAPPTAVVPPAQPAAAPVAAAPPTAVTPPAQPVAQGAPAPDPIPQVPSAPVPTAPKMAPPVVDAVLAPGAPSAQIIDSPAEQTASETPTTTGSES